MRNEKENPNFSIVRALNLGTELGVNIALPLVVCILTGNYLEKRFHASGLILVGMILIGLVVGGYNFYRVLKREVGWK
ncbi:MAG TPA: AtpZ/AtpI family protein [Candidatus Hydrogenedentes bacterium]|nr:AtpZ/AtpI family protein [Candidatus Hydrogenedentota bacterium]